MIGTVISFTLMAVAGREASSELDTFEILACRSLVGMLIILTIAAASGSLKELSGGGFRLHLLRNTLHFAATNLWFFAVATIPLAQVFAFEFATPLWTALLAPLFLAERLPRSRMIATLAGFAGILIIIRPGFIVVTPGVSAALFCAVGFAGAAVATRKLVRIQSVTAILFWMTCIQSVLSLLCAGIDGDIALPSARTALPLLIISICGLTAHLCLTKALAAASATLVMPLDFARLPVIALIGFFAYGEALDIFLGLGAAVILCANYANLRLAGKSDPGIY